eukprot:TRINITY_DN8961_c0_g1_i1.p1 TRINITY_DN8961_c0_g1~~TRINITY_DN8961_c0_g1_i1.p1  ORF type:complete len:442 (-),score=83.74 TRINITY_DN8961_c0_g1_i1:212-1537(-)
MSSSLGQRGATCSVCGLVEDAALMQQHTGACARMAAHTELSKCAESLSAVCGQPLAHARLVVMTKYDAAAGADENMARLFDQLSGGIHVPTYLAKGPVAELRREDQPEREPEFECLICFDVLPVGEMFTVDCAASHRYCFECIREHCDHSFPVHCPGMDCAHELTQLEVDQLFGARSAKALRFGEMQTQALLGSGTNFVACPGADCPAWVELPDADAPTESRWECECPECAHVFCNLCRGIYHYRTSCQAALDVREQWTDWMQGGRDAYQRQLADHKNYTQQQAAVEQRNRETLERHRELEQTEDWKVAHCKLCPHCNRVAERISGCTHMRCGQDYYGGNNQPGCGQAFDWNSAPPYTKQVGKAKIRKIGPPPPKPSRVEHTPYKCSMCSQDIVGLRFSCLNCKASDYCENCEWQCDHDPSHAFLIVRHPPDTTSGATSSA